MFSMERRVFICQEDSMLYVRYSFLNTAQSRFVPYSYLPLRFLAYVLENKTVRLSIQ